MGATPLKTLVLICLLSAAPQGWGAAADEPMSPVAMDALAARAARVEIIRDDYGVPHIYAATDADAVFGLLYAQAEDDFPRIERNYIWATGRLAEVEGKSALYSDLRARLYMTEAEARAAYAGAPPWLKALCDAFAEGLNYYLATHPAVKPALLTRFEPWMPMFFSEGSIGGDIEQIPLPGIAAFYGGDSTAAVRSQPLPAAEPAGSNGFAIAPQLTASGNALLLINPHTSFYFRGEVHVVSEEGLNAYGAVTWGQFFVYQGFNEHNGWMHTSTQVDFIDEFVEDVINRDGKLYYRYGDREREVRVSSAQLKYRDGDTLRERAFTLYHTHHGPITHSINGQWVATRINWDPVTALKQSFIRTKTRNLTEFRSMMDLRTNSSNNTVYADADGNIAYFHGNFVPRRDPTLDYSQPVDGSDPATDWRGRHELDDIISITNPRIGWIQNTNSTPFTAAGSDSPKADDYPTYMAPDPENFRGLHAVKVLTGQNELTLEKLIKLAYDPYLPAFETLLPGLVEAFDRSGNRYEELRQPIEQLRHWDYRVSTESVAMSLAHFYALGLLETGTAPTGQSRMQALEYYGRRSPDEQRLRVFANTVANLAQDYGHWNTPWGEINRFQRLNGDIAGRFDDAAPSLPIAMASGRWGALASFGAKRFDNSLRLYGYAGNSFVAVVEFGDKVRAKTLLAGGQSGDPQSPHFRDQAVPYAQGRFKEAAFYRQDVERRQQRRYRPGRPKDLTE